MNSPSLLSPAGHVLLTAGLTDLIGTDPLSLDRPGAHTLVFRIVAGKVAMLDQAATGMPALEVDDLELAVVSASDSGKTDVAFRRGCFWKISVRTWHMTASLWLVDDPSFAPCGFDCLTRC